MADRKKCPSLTGLSPCWEGKLDGDEISRAISGLNQVLQHLLQSDGRIARAAPNQ